MGIKSLLKFLSTYPNLVQTKEQKDYKGITVAIDISILIYQVVIAIRNSGSDLTNSAGEISSHILGLFNKTINLLDRGIIPVYVFDGKPPSLKSKILDARKQVKQKALEKLEVAQSTEEKIKYLKRSVTINKEQMEQCKELLEAMGVPFITAPEEADSQLAWLCKTGRVDAVITEDMDILTFGSPKIIRNLTSMVKKPIEINLENVLTTLGLNQDQFIELCMLFGCDYCPGITDVKQEDIYAIYKKHLNIPDTVAELRVMGYYVPNVEQSSYLLAKNYFKESIHWDISHEFLRLRKPDSNRLLELLVGKWSFIKNRVKYKVDKLDRIYNFKKVDY